ncbi:UNVERIFIED_CONTAM: Transposon Tf2-12 polyprotein [Sesamum calycinum]|uniref:Transposon Tf2-12 polyprotein n=1 Tax=Sesamum calycinum TaxID=2727403 RepID=A0AAW2PB38_9LAMI
MEVYIDDILVKSAKEQDHIKDLEECFQILTTFSMKLNPAKCTFGVRGGRFLGHMISERGIEANSEKINAIMDMSPSKLIREFQKLAGRLAALNRFISRSADKGLPFFKILRGIEFHPRPAIKAQVLADFVVELAYDEASISTLTWSLYVDGPSTSTGSGAGVALESPQRDKFEYAIKLEFPSSNNEAEYEAFLAGGKLVLAAGAKRIVIYSDSQLVVNQKEEIIIFLINGVQPENKKDAKVLRRKASRFIMIDGELYKRGFSQPFLKCLTPEEGNYVLREIHEGICGNHLGGKALAEKSLRQGFYWLTMLVGAHELVKDLVGPLPQAKISEKKVIKFLWRNIVCRFGIPHAIISDNGTQFSGNKLKEWCKGLAIKQFFTSVSNPQANGQTEVTNRTILQHLKMRLETAKGAWVDELPSVLWGIPHNTPDHYGRNPI